MSDKNVTPQPGPAPDCGEMRKEKKSTPLTMEEMSRMHIGAGRVQPPAGAEQTDPKLPPEVEWIMKTGGKIGKGLAAVGKGISNVMDAASSAVESAGNFLDDCACEVSSWDWGWFDFLLNGARGYSGEGGGFSPYKLFGAAAKGTHNFVFGTVKGLFNMVGHPVETATGIGHAVTHPKELLNGLKEQYWGSRKNWTQKVSGVTEAVCDIAFLAYGAKKGFDKLSKGAKARKAAKIAETGETAGKAVKAGEVAEEAAKAGGKGTVRIESAGETPGYVNTCFAKGTLILMETNLKNIEEIKQNELIWSKDVETGKTGSKKVLQVFKHYQDYFVYLYVNGDIIKTTANHPFWIHKKGWVHAENIKIGDLLKNSSGDNVMIDFVELVHIKEPIVVYNLEVEGWHTYFVSENNILVHNKPNLHNMPGWIKHDVYNAIRNRFGQNGVNKFVNSMKKGIVGGKGENGIKMLSGKGIKLGGKFYQYEIKIKGGLGDWRVFGNYDSSSGHIIFDKFTTGAH